MKLTRKWGSLDPKRFKELINNLYSIYPDGALSGDVEIVINNKTVLASLLNHGYLIQEKGTTKEGNDRNWYTLRPNALSLVSAWKMEESSKQMERSSLNVEKSTLSIEKMTAIIVVLTLVLIGLGILPFSVYLAKAIVGSGILLWFLLLFYTPRQLLGIKQVQ